MNPMIVIATAAGAALLAGGALAQTKANPNAGWTGMENTGSSAYERAAAINSPSTFGPSYSAQTNAPNAANAGVGVNTTSGAGRSARSADYYGSNTSATVPDTRSGAAGRDDYGSGSTTNSGSAVPVAGERR